LSSEDCCCNSCSHFPHFFCSIIYRDIKPDNIGFDVRGDVKIFDFGLAKEFDPNSVDADGTYKLTADTGSPRYMATEVSLGQPYNESCDVYSFCILLWQILKLETPFDGYTMNMFNKKVVQKGSRPMCDPKWPDEITEMLRLGWGSIIKSRPSMEDICSTLRDEIQSKTDEEVDEIMDASRKSELSLHRGF
jgi:serine/threonine protein kinase